MNVAGTETERTQLTSCCLKVQVYMFGFIRTFQRLKLCREIVSNLEEFSTLIIYKKGPCIECYDMNAFQNKISRDSSAEVSADSKHPSRKR